MEERSGGKLGNVISYGRNRSWKAEPKPKRRTRRRRSRRRRKSKVQLLCGVKKFMGPKSYFFRNIFLYSLV